MRGSFWVRILMWALLAGTLVACGGLGGSRTQTAIPEYTPVPGTEGLGPIPHYRLDLLLISDEKRLKGRQQVTIPNRTGVSLNEIVFRLYPNLPQYGGRVDVGPVWVDGERAPSTLRAEDTSLVVPLTSPLAPESSLTISLTFSVEIPQRAGGYVLFGRSQGIWSLPDAYPLLAVHDGKQWHEDLAPAYADSTFANAADYEVSLTLPSTLTLVTTGPVVSSTVETGNQRLYQVSSGPLRQFVWLAGAEYAVAETTASGTTVRSFYLPGDEAAGRAALNIAAAALRVYAEAFGSYPFSEMTVVEAPLVYYGMEYPGLNLIGVDLYRDQRRELEIRVAHEIAHQWWYNQVGNDQINTPWLDEGLAEYSTAIYYGEVYGPARVNALTNQRWLLPYQTAVDSGLDAIVNQPSAAFGQAQVYEVMVYAKAALFFDHLRQELGTDAFLATLKEYLHRYRWRIATPEDLLRVAEEVSGKDLDGLYSQWILTSK